MRYRGGVRGQFFDVDAETHPTDSSADGDLDFIAFRQSVKPRHLGMPSMPMFGCSCSVLCGHGAFDLASSIWIGFYTIWDQVTVRAFASIHSVTQHRALEDNPALRPESCVG